MTNQTRRDVLKKGLQVAAVGVGAGLIWDLFLQKSAKAQGFVPRPPGALPPDRFETACSKCGLCVEACPYDTLKLARFNDIAAPGTPFFTPRDIPLLYVQRHPLRESLSERGAVTRVNRHY